MALPGRPTLQAYRELVIVLVAAIVGLTIQAPLAWMVRHQGINVLLAILVFATAISIEPKTLRHLPSLWRELLSALLIGAIALPALSWLVGFLVHGGRSGRRHHVGLAPCEIASIATTAMAGGSVVLAGGLLIGSTVLTVIVSGPILALEADHASVHPGHIITNLLIVVALPLALAIIVRLRRALPARLEPVAQTTSSLSVAALVALTAAEIHLDVGYLRVAGALLLFLAASIAVSIFVGRGHRAGTGSALLLTISMRDFAIAAGLATTAFGSAAAAPLGLYGIMVLGWGTGCAGYLRAKH